MCLDSWTHPVQLKGCGHIFCKSCIGNTKDKCKICGAISSGFCAPPDDIVAAAQNVEVCCTSCGWRGTRKASLNHRCDPTQTHSPYLSYPPLTDDEWVRLALEGRKGAGVSGTRDALPSSEALGSAVVNGVVL